MTAIYMYFLSLVFMAIDMCQLTKEIQEYK